MSATRGFTLAEAMISVAILGLIGMLTYGTFASAMNAKEQAARITEHYHQVRQAMLRMSREIAMAYLSEHRDCDEPRTRTIFTSSGTTGGARLDFTAFAHYKTRPDANESDQVELAYFVGRDPDEPSKTVLLRRKQPRIDEEPDKGGVEEVLAENVEALTFSFYDAQDDEWADEWDTRDSEFRQRLPRFVKISMKVKGLDGKDETFSTKTRVFLQRPLKIWGTGAPTCPND